MINNIQALRAFAAINVIVYHVILTSLSYSKELNFISFIGGWGANGVDVFFVISGFIMHYTQLNNFRTAHMFFLNRIIRIVPIYWLMTVFLYLLYLLMPSVFREMKIDSDWLISSLFFTSLFFEGKNPVLYVGWTLEWEMMFYFVFALSILLKSMRNQALLIFCIIMFFCYQSSNWIAIDFLLGVFVSILYKKLNLNINQGRLLLGAGFVFLASSIPFSVTNEGFDRVFFWGLPSFLIVFGALYCKQIQSKFIELLGDASYSIYLLQVLTIPAYYKFTSKLFSEINGELLAFLCVCFSVLCGIVFYSMVERPIVKKLKRMYL